MGKNCNPVTIPVAVPEWLVSSVSTSQSCAVRCIHAPVLETNPPRNHSR